MIPSFVYKLRNREQMGLLDDFSARQWLSPEQLLADGDSLARRLAIHAKTSVPYYRKIFQQLQLDPTTMHLPEDWGRIPLLSKETLRQEYEGLRSDASQEQRSYVNFTGGSTGIPVKFLTDFLQHKRMGAWMDLTFSWAGWQPGELRLELWGNKERRLPPTLWDRIRASLSGHFVIPVYSYTEKNLYLWWQVLSSMRPTIIYGYPSVLADFSEWLESENHIPNSVKGIFSSAEILYPEQRRGIEKVFGCKVYNQYGSRETPCLACECPEGGMHVFVDFNRVEFSEIEKDSVKNKEIIVTPLYNYVQPLLRYQIGDMGLSNDESCSCGRGYPLMHLNVARSRDFLFGIDGSRFYPGFFTRLMDGKDWVRSFQFVQKSMGSLELNIESEYQDSDTLLSRLIEEIRPKIEEEMGTVELVVNMVAKINRLKAGKHRFVVNEVAGGEEGRFNAR